MNKIFSLGWYNHECSALVPRNCNGLTVHGPFIAPFLLVLDIGPETQRTPSLQLDRGLTFLSAFYMAGSAPSLTRSCDKYAHCGPPIYRNYKTAAVESVYTSTTDDNCRSCVFLLSDRSHTITWVSYSALPVLLVLVASVPLLPSSSQIPDSGPCRVPGLCILCTTLPRVPLAVVPYSASSSAFPSIDFVIARGFFGLPTPNPVSVFYAISSPFPTLLPGLKASVVTTSSSGVASKTPQTMHGAAHPLASY